MKKLSTVNMQKSLKVKAVALNSAISKCNKIIISSPLYKSWIHYSAKWWRLQANCLQAIKTWNSILIVGKNKFKTMLHNLCRAYFLMSYRARITLLLCHDSWMINMIHVPSTGAYLDTKSLKNDNLRWSCWMYGCILKWLWMESIQYV